LQVLQTRSVALVRHIVSMTTRRSMIAGLAGLAASGAAGNSRAAAAPSDLPPAAEALNGTAPAPAPVLRFTDAAGVRRTLADYAGHGLVVNLWATWCGPCVAELPTLAAAAPELARAGILVLPISIDTTGAQVVKPFYASQGITDLPILLDPSGDAMDTLNASGIPVTIVIDTQGRLVARVDGAVDWSTKATLRALRGLTGATVPHPGVQPV
jgi:thiol-disulfide isomerase/thioredoxin